MLKHFNGVSIAATNRKYNLEMRHDSFRPLSFFNPQTLLPASTRHTQGAGSIIATLHSYWLPVTSKYYNLHLHGLEVW